MEDALLIEAYQQGDQTAFDQLAARHQGMLYRIALRQLGHHDDAQDAVQEMLLRLMRSLPQYRGQARFTSWLYRLAVNTCIDLQRRQGRRAPSAPLDQELPASPEQADPDTQCERHYRDFLLDQALQALPEPQRILLHLRDREGRPTHEVAALLGIDVGTLKSRLHRARGALRRLLEEGVAVRGQEQHGRYRINPSGGLA